MKLINTNNPLVDTLKLVIKKFSAQYFCRQPIWLKSDLDEAVVYWDNLCSVPCFVSVQALKSIDKQTYFVRSKVSEIFPIYTSEFWSNTILPGTIPLDIIVAMQHFLRIQGCIP